MTSYHCIISTVRDLLLNQYPDNGKGIEVVEEKNNTQ